MGWKLTSHPTEADREGERGGPLLPSVGLPALSAMPGRLCCWQGQHLWVVVHWSPRLCNALISLILCDVLRGHGMKHVYGKAVLRKIYLFILNIHFIIFFPIYFY